MFVTKNEAALKMDGKIKNFIRKSATLRAPIAYKMIIYKNGNELTSFLQGLKKDGKSIGFVPTMGALHAGHISLIEAARQQNDIVVASIFVNPTQFNNQDDFKNYPITTAQDIELLEAAQCDVLYLPSVMDVYPNGPEQTQHYDFGYLEKELEGEHRPGHFKGVGQVVSVLLNMVQPDVLYLGQKDYQQCMVIANLIQQMGLEKNITLVMVPTMREDDGLAMSSRNRRLTDAQRSLAGVIYQCLISIVTKKNITAFDIVQKECIELLQQKGFIPEYVALADADTLELLKDYDDQKKMVALIAAHLGNVRLIDNMLVR